MDVLKDWIAIIGGGSAIALLLYRVFADFGRRDAQDLVTARDLERKADKHEVSAMKERVESLERTVLAQGATIKADVEKSLAKIDVALSDFKAAFNTEHRRRSDENLDLQVLGAELRERIAALETRVFGETSHKPMGPRRRAEDQT